MDHISVIVVIIVIVLVMVFVVRSGIGAGLVAGWRIIAITLEAIVHIPLAIILFFIGAIAVLAMRDLFGCIIAGVCLYSGGNLLFGVIDGYVKSSRTSKPDR
jgi:hypothetical protein